MTYSPGGLINEDQREGLTLLGEVFQGLLYHLTFKRLTGALGKKTKVTPLIDKQARFSMPQKKREKLYFQEW